MGPSLVNHHHHFNYGSIVHVCFALLAELGEMSVHLEQKRPEKWSVRNPPWLIAGEDTGSKQVSLNVQLRAREERKKGATVTQRSCACGRDAFEKECTIQLAQTHYRIRGCISSSQH